jgi:hypothetical protein
VPSYNLLSELLLEHKSYSHNSSLLKLLSCIITLINISNIIRTRQTEHIKDKTEAIIITEVFREALETTVALKIVAVSKKVKTIINIICYLHVRRSVIFITS